MTELLLLILIVATVVAVAEFAGYRRQIFEPRLGADTTRDRDRQRLLADLRSARRD